jgi:hypothetical protein
MKQQDAVTLLIVIVVLYALYKLNQFITGVSSGMGAPEGSQTGGSEQDEPVKEKLTYPAWKYNQLADTIEGAIWDGLGFTEDDDAIQFALVQMNNDDDFLALSNAYGVRGRGLILRDYYNLPTSINNYLDVENRMQVNTNYQNKGMLTRI